MDGSLNENGRLAVSERPLNLTALPARLFARSAAAFALETTTNLLSTYSTIFVNSTFGTLWGTLSFKQLNRKNSCLFFLICCIGQTQQQMQTIEPGVYRNPKARRSHGQGQQGHEVKARSGK